MAFACNRVEMFVGLAAQRHKYFNAIKYLFVGASSPKLHNRIAGNGFYSSSAFDSCHLTFANIPGRFLLNYNTCHRVKLLNCRSDLQQFCVTICTTHIRKSSAKDDHTSTTFSKETDKATTKKEGKVNQVKEVLDGDKLAVKNRRLKTSETVRVIGGPLVKEEIMTIAAARKRFSVLGYELVLAKNLETVDMQTYQLIPIAQVIKSQRAAAKEAKKQEPKIILLTTKASVHDRDIKLKHALELVEKGDEVRIKVRSRDVDRPQRAEVLKAVNEVMKGKAKVKQAVDSDRELIIQVYPIDQSKTEGNSPKLKPLTMAELKNQRQKEVAKDETN